MLRFIGCLLLVLLIFVGTNYSQYSKPTPATFTIESNPGKEGQQFYRDISHAAHDSIKLLYAGGYPGWIPTQIIFPWEYTGVTFWVTGDNDSVDILARIMVGYADSSRPAPGRGRGEVVDDSATTNLHFTQCDSIIIDSTGKYVHQIGNMPVCEHMYILFDLQSDNGSQTAIRGRITRSR